MNEEMTDRQTDTGGTGKGGREGERKRERERETPVWWSGLSDEETLLPRSTMCLLHRVEQRGRFIAPR